MNAVEIEEAVSELAGAPFDSAEFPFAFLTAFGNKATTVNRLRTPSLNKSDVVGGVLQARNVHLAVCPEGQVRETMALLRASPKTTANRAKFILATDGVTLEAEDIVADEPPIVCNYPDFAEHFGFFLPLAGISTVRAIKNNPIDIKATGRLNKLYVELLKDNPEWETDARRQEMNQFMARLIFCFFAEDTGIFLNHLFTKTIEQMSDSQSGNTQEVLQELFRAMDTEIEDRKGGNFRPWAEAFPYVNGGLFTGSVDCPRFSRIARSYLLRAAELNWQEINPDIFGSMIQAVADDEERGELGMHYTSVPNILKVLNPLFLDDLREQLEAAGDNARKLRNLRKRLSTIRVFDPACGSGNFLVIAYIRMREIEQDIVKRTGDGPKSWIPLSNFYGIEIKGFAAEIARLSLLISEFQCDVRMISQQEARLNVLPLHKTGQIRIGNALLMDWLEVCPPAKKETVEEQDLGGPTGRLALDQNGLNDAREPETYVCGNPPYKGGTEQTNEQKSDLEAVLSELTDSWKSLDYVSGWFVKFANYATSVDASCAFVSTNSITQGEQVARLWPLIMSKKLSIIFAHTAFKWRNLATHNAGVTVVVIGLGRKQAKGAILFESAGSDEIKRREVSNINAYLVPHEDILIAPRSNALCAISEMTNGNKPADGGNLILSLAEARSLMEAHPSATPFIRPFVGAADSIQGLIRYCLWIDADRYQEARAIKPIAARLDRVAEMRRKSTKPLTIEGANTPFAFQQVRQRGDESVILIPRHSSESRPFLPVSLQESGAIVADGAFAVFDADLWNFAILASRIHLVWIAAVCGRIKTDYRYSSTLGWNTFPIVSLTEKNKADLTRCAEEILLAREAHFSATIADLYDPENMPDDLRAAHERNDEMLERVYIGRRFRNDTERLEKLFDLYTKMRVEKETGGRTTRKPTRKNAA